MPEPQEPVGLEIGSRDVSFLAMPQGTPIVVMASTTDDVSRTDA
jgi:hypothetical protein